MTENVVFSGNVIEMNGNQIHLDFPVKDAFRRGDRVFVLFDPDAEAGNFRNLVCLDLSGRQLWKADLPEPGRQDVYYRIAARRPLVVHSFSSYKVEIDTETGAILSKEFVK